jgi:hypothetical protein
VCYCLCVNGPKLESLSVTTTGCFPTGSEEGVGYISRNLVFMKANSF